MQRKLRGKKIVRQIAATTFHSTYRFAFMSLSTFKEKTKLKGMVEGNSTCLYLALLKSRAQLQDVDAHAIVISLGNLVQLDAITLTFP